MSREFPTQIFEFFAYTHDGKLFPSDSTKMDVFS